MKELPLALKYTIYSTMSLWQIKGFTLSQGKKKKKEEREKKNGKKINKYSKNIGLWNIFTNFLWEKKKVTDFFIAFYTYNKKWYQNISKMIFNKYPKSTRK